MEREGNLKIFYFLSKVRLIRNAVLLPTSVTLELVSWEKMVFYIINFCKINDLVILNGRTNSDSEGKFTCIANRGRSIVDYFVTDRGLYEHVIDLEVIARPESDHFPLLLTLNCHLSYNEFEQNADPINCTPIKNLVWNEKYKDHYNAILDEQFNDCKDELLSLIPINIDDAIEKLIKCITYAAEYVQPQNDGNSNLRKVYQPPWWNKECT